MNNYEVVTVNNSQSYCNFHLTVLDSRQLKLFNADEENLRAEMQGIRKEEKRADQGKIQPFSIDNFLTLCDYKSNRFQLIS
jgi:hypothetical protein